MVDSPSLRPQEFPSTVNLKSEQFLSRTDPLQVRADGVSAPMFSVHAPKAGRYRFTIELHNAKAAGDAMGVFKLTSDGGASGMTAPIKDDKWHQTGVLELKAGVWLICLYPQKWKASPLLREVRIENAD